jgi:hypothetical protein
MASITYRKNGEARSFEGPEATQFYRLNVLIQGLKLESLGIRVSRGASCLSIAKQETGLRTNDRAKLTLALRAKAEELLAQCEQIHETE